jgi:hypothetical protein
MLNVTGLAEPVHPVMSTLAAASVVPATQIKTNPDQPPGSNPRSAGNVKTPAREYKRRVPMAEFCWCLGLVFNVK